MAVNVFERTGYGAEKDSGHVIFRGVTMAQANDAFLRRDGGPRLA